jgi:hypothetical protein
LGRQLGGIFHARAWILDLLVDTFRAVKGVTCQVPISSSTAFANGQKCPSRRTRALT